MTNEELVAEYQKGNESAFNELIEKNKGIRASLTKKYSAAASANGIDTSYCKKGQFNELEQECVIALYEACRDYKFVGNNFFQYAYKVTKNRIINLIWKRRNNTSKNYRKNFKSIEFLSLDQQNSDDENSTLENILADEGSAALFYDIEKSIDDELLKKDIEKLLTDMFADTENYTILHMFYGLGQLPLDYIQIAEKLNMDINKIIDIERSSIKLLRYSPKSEWFICKYGIDYNMEMLDTVSSINNPELYVQMKDTYTSSIDEIFKLCVKEEWQ